MQIAASFTELSNKPWFRVGVRSVVYVLLSLLLLHEATTSSLVEECSGSEAPAGALSRTDYTTIVQHASFHAPLSHKVVLVTFSSGTEPDAVLAKICSQRLFTSRLIRRLNDLGAAVIALDKQYGVSSCDVNGAETKALVKAMQESRAIITRGLPTVIIPAQNVGGKKICLRELPTLELPIPPQNSGLLRLDADTRRAPLSWPVVQDDGVHIRKTDTLAWITAKAADAGALDTVRSRSAYKSGEQPYSTMTKISNLSALKILCGQTADSSVDWQSCTSAEPWSEINGATVVIGDHNGDSDRHPTVGGFVYGVDLQANYIAALLDQRYYLPLLSDSENKLAVVIFFFLVLLIYWGFKPRLRAFLYSLSLWGIILIVSILILAFTGYLVTIWVQGINFVTLVIIFLEHWAAEMS